MPRPSLSIDTTGDEETICMKLKNHSNLVWLGALLSASSLLGCSVGYSGEEQDSAATADGLALATYRFGALGGTSKCLDVSAASTADGAVVQSYACNGTAAQSFRVDSLGGVNYRIVNINSNKCLDVKDHGTADGTAIQQWSCVTGNDAQSFRIEDVGSGMVRIVHGTTGKCLDVAAASTADGAKVQIYTCNGTNAQTWVATDVAAPPPPPPPPSGLRVVAYLPNYSGSYATWATTINFSKMTHLNLAFATATSQNGWNMGAPDADVNALVNAAHTAGVKVLASLGGGGGDQTVIARYNTASNIDPLVANLDAFVTSHNFDGVDVDIEDGSQLGANYASFVSKTVNTLRPKGKLVTAAVAQYLQGGMADSTLHLFDFVNVMIYTNYNDSVAAMNFYTGTKSVPKSQVTIGAGFFGTDSGGYEYAYKDILAADSSAWSKDSAWVFGKTVNYTGMATMKQITDYSRGFGGIMFWELSQDTTDSHSLYKVIQGEM
jgi:hypothetical protein